MPSASRVTRTASLATDVGPSLQAATARARTSESMRCFMGAPTRETSALALRVTPAAEGSLQLECDGRLQLRLELTRRRSWHQAPRADEYARRALPEAAHVSERHHHEAVCRQPQARRVRCVAVRLEGQVRGREPVRVVH